MREPVGGAEDGGEQLGEGREEVGYCCGDGHGPFYYYVSCGSLLRTRVLLRQDRCGGQLMGMVDGWMTTREGHVAMVMDLVRQDRDVGSWLGWGVMTSTTRAADKPRRTLWPDKVAQLPCGRAGSLIYSPSVVKNLAGAPRPVLCTFQVGRGLRRVGAWLPTKAVLHSQRRFNGKQMY